MKIDFFEHDEKKTIDQFLDQGYVIIPVASPETLLEIKNELFQISRNILNFSDEVKLEDFFNHTEKYVTIESLNDFRVQVIHTMNTWNDLRPSLYHLGKKYIDWIVGNEICQQRAINLSIQLSNDKSSLLPLHTDVWSGNSPYEVVFWVPLVNCYQTKSMFLIPYKESQKVLENFSDYSHLNVEELYQEIKGSAIELNVPFGSAVIFSHSILHGNRVNLENECRWTFNVRFKSLLSPYGSKEIGETFLPITIRPLTRIGFHYKKPILNKAQL